MVKATNDTFDPKSFLPKVGEGKTKIQEPRMRFSVHTGLTDTNNSSRLSCFAQTPCGQRRNCVCRHKRPGP